MEAEANEVKSLNKNIDDLYKKYEALSKKVELIEKESKSTEQSMKRIESSFGAMNNNLEAMMNKLDSIAEDREAGRMFRKESRRNCAMRNMITRPMRKLAVGTMSTVFEISGYASEKMSCAREGLEDMIAEAHYNSKRRRENGMGDMGAAAGTQ